MANQSQQNAGQNDSSAIQGDLEAAQKQIADLTETAKRALADLQNYRRQVEREKSSFAAFANISLILELLPMLDNFQRAFTSVPEEIAKTDWFKGALQIEQQLAGVVKKQGVKEMEPQTGKKLDPNLHEAISTGPGELDVILEEFEKGYLLGDKVIRPAKVKVGTHE